MAIPKLISYSLPTKKELPSNKVYWTIDTHRSVMLIHDMQKYFCNFFDTNNYKLQKFIDNIILLRKFCRIYNIPIIYTIQPYQDKKKRALLSDMWGKGLNNIPEETNIIDQLTPNIEDQIIIKNRYSAFYLTKLESYLKQINRDQLIITGIYAHIGCLITCIESFMRNIETFMIADAMADFGIAEHIMALNYAANCSGKILMTSEVILLPVNKQNLRDIIEELLLDHNNYIIQDDENLIDYGLNSIQIMELSSKWNTIKKNINFIKLAQNPTINAWWDLLSK